MTSWSPMLLKRSRVVATAGSKFKINVGLCHVSSAADMGCCVLEFASSTSVKYEMISKT